MFSYYGSKSKVIDLYPAPRYGKIIEPFAGSARYALKYWDRDVLLVDKYEVIVRIWKYLQRSSRQDILGLPDLKRHDDIRTMGLSDDERLLIGFCINGESVTPKNIVADFQDWNSCKVEIAKNVDKIRHWQIEQGDYRGILNQEATWFIDPPYQNGGILYVESSRSINFASLSDWCKSRYGQVIVCENTKANWMPFTPIGNMKGAVHTTTEAIWCNDVQQTKLEGF